MSDCLHSSIWNVNTKQYQLIFHPTYIFICILPSINKRSHLKCNAWKINLKGRRKDNFTLNHKRFGLPTGSCVHTVSSGKAYFFSSFSTVETVLHKGTGCKCWTFFPETCRMSYNLENVFFLANIHEIPGVYLPEQMDNFKIIYYFLTYKGENVNPAFDTAHPAGLVQDFMTLVACPAPALLPWSLSLDKLKESSEPVRLLHPATDANDAVWNLTIFTSGCRAGNQNETAVYTCLCVVSMEGMNLEVKGTKSKLDAESISEVSNVLFLHTLSSAEWWMLSAKIITYFQMLNEQQ